MFALPLEAPVTMMVFAVILTRLLNKCQPESGIFFKKIYKIWTEVFRSRAGGELNTNEVYIELTAK